MGGTWQWLMDFIGVNNGENEFATHMYNFWSGFGGNVSVLAVLGAGLGAYRHYLTKVHVPHGLHPRRRHDDDGTTGDAED